MSTSSTSLLTHYTWNHPNLPFHMERHDTSSSGPSSDKVAQIAYGILRPNGGGNSGGRGPKLGL